MPTFSIVIPVYNGQDHLRECLDSMLGQTYSDIEVICVDDCGTDASLDILQEYAARDARLRILRQSENRGSARAVGAACWNPRAATCCSPTRMTV